MDVCSPEEECKLGASLWVGKVYVLECIARADRQMTVLWYWPTWHEDQRMPWRMAPMIRELEVTGLGFQQTRDDNILVNIAMIAWTNLSGRSTLMGTVHDMGVEKKIRIPKACEVYMCYLVFLILYIIFLFSLLENDYACKSTWHTQQNWKKYIDDNVDSKVVAMFF